MSGLNEIKEWTQKNLMKTIRFIDNIEDAYDFVNNNFIQEGRSNLDDILADDKPSFLDWLDGKISPPEPPEDLIKVKAFSYVNFKGTIVNVKSHFRHKVKR